MKLYEKLARDIEGQILKGVYRDGERLQSVRETSRQRQVSITTVLRAYLLLESRGLIKTRPQSGFYVTPPAGERAPAGGQADTARPIAISSPVDVSRLVLSTLRTISQGHAIPLGSPYPDPAGFAFDKLGRYAHAASKDASLNELRNALPPGHPSCCGRSCGATWTRAWSSIRPSPSSPWARPRPSICACRPWPGRAT